MSQPLPIFFTVVFLISQLHGDVIARLIKAEGNVHFKRLGMNSFLEKAKPGAAIRNGDEIKVGDPGFGAIMYLDDRTILKIK